MTGATDWKSRFLKLDSAVSTLSEFAGQQSYRPIERGGLINQYLLAYELSWKVMKDYLFEVGVDVRNPRDTIRASFENGLIEDVEMWLKMHVDRTLFVHVYDEGQAIVAIDLIRQRYLPMLTRLVSAMRSRLDR